MQTNWRCGGGRLIINEWEVALTVEQDLWANSWNSSIPESHHPIHHPPSAHRYHYYYYLCLQFNRSLPWNRLEIFQESCHEIRIFFAATQQLVMKMKIFTVLYNLQILWFSWSVRDSRCVFPKKWKTRMRQPVPACVRPAVAPLQQTSALLKSTFSRQNLVTWPLAQLSPQTGTAEGGAVCFNSDKINHFETDYKEYIKRQ